MTPDEASSKLGATVALLSCYNRALTGRWLHPGLAPTGASHWRQQAFALRRETAELQRQLAVAKQLRSTTEAEAESLKGRLLVAQSDVILCQSRGKVLQMDARMREAELADHQVENRQLLQRHRELCRIVDGAGVADRITNSSITLFKDLLNNQVDLELRRNFEGNLKSLLARQEDSLKVLQQPITTFNGVFDECRKALVDLSQETTAKLLDVHSSKHNHSDTGTIFENSLPNGKTGQAKGPDRTKRLVKLRRKYQRAIAKVGEKLSKRRTGRHRPTKDLLSRKADALEDMISRQRKDLLRLSLENAELKQKLFDATGRFFN